MFDKKTHPNSRTMLDAWRRMTAAPENLASGPQANHYPELLSRLFVLQRQPGHDWAFRSCGEDLPDLLGRDLSEHGFTDLWKNTDKTIVEAALSAVFDNDEPAMIRATGETLTGRQVSIEIPLAPITTSSGKSQRILGLYQTLGGEAMLGGRAIWRHNLTALYPPVLRSQVRHIRLVASND